MNRENLVDNLKSSLRGMSLEQFSRLFIDEVKAVEEFYKLCHGVNAGKTISLLFNPHRLDTLTLHSISRTSAPMSIYASLSDEGNENYTEKIDGLARLYLYNLENGVNNPFYSAVQRGYNGVTYVNEFPPYVARQIYLEYADCSKHISVLDPCGGWGGRMIGCASIPNSRYVCCEPCTRTYEGLVKLGNWLKTLQPSFEFEVHKIPYEDFKTEEQFDIALTSPPYYDTEKYSTEETNSLNRYKTYESWIEGFYNPLVLTTLKRLKGNAPFILNVGDRKYPLSDSLYEVCEDNDLHLKRITDYLSGNGETKEKFYCVTKDEIKQTIRKKLF